MGGQASACAQARLRPGRCIGVFIAQAQERGAQNATEESDTRIGNGPLITMGAHRGKARAPMRKPALWPSTPPPPERGLQGLAAECSSKAALMPDGELGAQPFRVGPGRQRAGDETVVAAAIGARRHDVGLKRGE